jgi:hypothetical protein
MTSMPTSDDRMLVLFRRTGKRRASYRPAQRGRVVAGGGARVVLQRSPGCFSPGADCITPRGELGICDGKLNCVVDPFPGGFEIPR